MTKTDFNTKYGRVAMPTPFAGGSNATKATIYDAGTGGDFNFADGFASPYSAPKSNNGKFVTRGEINCLGNVATANEFNHMCGGLNIFDVEFAKKIGGYPQDAVLDILVGTQLYKIQSLQDNNLVNPYGVSSSPVVGGSVDGVWWRYLLSHIVFPEIDAAAAFPNCILIRDSRFDIQLQLATQCSDSIGKDETIRLVPAGNTELTVVIQQNIVHIILCKSSHYRM